MNSVFVLKPNLQEHLGREGFNNHSSFTVKKHLKAILLNLGTTAIQGQMLLGFGRWSLWVSGCPGNFLASVH